MNGQSVTLLLVEDNDIDREAVRRAFRQHHVDSPIHDAIDGVEALEILRGNGREPLARPYLIFLDLNMPRMNGIEFLEALRSDERLRDSVVFVLTTSASEEDLVAAYERNIAGYILKSDIGLDFGKLAALVDTYVHTVELPH